MGDLEKILAEFKKEGLTVDKQILERILEDKKITRCPLCKSRTKKSDNFGTEFVLDTYNVEVYCSSCNYILELEVVFYQGRDAYSILLLRMYTNAKYSTRLASVILSSQNECLELGR